MFQKLYKSVIQPVIEIRPHERLKTFLMFGYFFFTISLVYILKPVRNSLFLDELGAQNLRYVYMGEGVFLLFIVWAYVQFSKRVSKKTLFNGALLFFTSCLILIWFLFRIKLPYLSAYFYIWVASFSITMTTQFWMLANDIFNPAEAKRLFGLIISGGSLGGILGGILTSQAVRWMRTEDLMFVAAGILILCMLLLHFLWKALPGIAETKAAPAIDQNKTSAKPNQKSQDNVSARKLLFGSSYLIMLAGLVILAKMASTVVDNQFNGIVEISIMGKDERTAFFGGFMAGLNALSFCMQLFVTSLALRYLGVGLSLWILPVGLTLTSGLTFLTPVLMTGLAIKLFDGSVNYSIQQASREVLYLPIQSAVRYRVKPVIDMLGFRVAKSLGGLYIAFLAPLWGLPDHRLSALVLCLIPVWLIIVWKMKKGYAVLLRSQLMDREQFERVTSARRATDVMSSLYDEKTFEEIKSFIDHRSSYARKLAATAYLTYTQSGKDLEAARRVVDQIIEDEALKETHGKKPLSVKETEEQDIRFLEDLIFYGSKEQAVKSETVSGYLEHYPDDALKKLGDIVREEGKSLEIKRRTLRLLGLLPKQEVVNLLIESLKDARDHAFRFEIIKTLNRLHDRNATLLMNRAAIKKEIFKEISLNEKIQKVRSYYETHRSASASDDYLAVTLKAIQDESLERVFHALDLLYPHEMMQIVYDRIVSRSPEDPVRSHAIELLHNSIEHDLFIALQRILEGCKDAPMEKEFIKILEEFAESPDRWFALTSFFLMTDLKLDIQHSRIKESLERSSFRLFQSKT